MTSQAFNVKDIVISMTECKAKIESLKIYEGVLQEDMVQLETRTFSYDQMDMIYTAAYDITVIEA